MNMKKLIDQADFDNVQQISRRWKKDLKSSPLKQSSSDLAQMLNSRQSQKQNVHDSNLIKSLQGTEKNQKDSGNNLCEVSIIASNNNSKKRQVIPQVMDEDTEHFKNRLEHLLNTFKTDAVGEFMGMKKTMLDYQKQTIKSDTQKYLQMYQQKHQQLLTTKQSLISVSKELQKKTIQVQLMSNYIHKLNQRIKSIKYLSRPFALLYENRVQEKTLKVKYINAQRSDNKRVLNKSFGGWRNVWREVKDEKQKQNNEKRINDQVKDIVNRLNKQMQILRQQLNQSLKRNQQYQSNKHIVQQNLKKAFLRGMCAMNMEAMGVLGDSDTNSQQNNYSMVQMNNNSLMNVSQMAMTEANYPLQKNLGQSNVHMTSQKVLNSLSMPNNNSILMGKVKTQSKEHRWKQAPIMGIQQNDECQEPRPILVKPTTQGKVIKVVDGKSSTVDSKKTIPPVVSCTKQHVPIKQTPNSRSSLMSSRKN